MSNSNSPINKKPIWVFGAWEGKRYSDNSKYFFEYINKNHPEIRAVWITKNRNVLTHIKNKGFEAYMAYSLKGCYFAMKSQAVITCQPPRLDINNFVVFNRAKLVQLWHGIPLKKIGFDDRIFLYTDSFVSNIKIFLTKLLCPSPFKKYALITATSEENKQRFQSSFDAHDDTIKITGFPRNDALFSFNKQFIKKEKNQKIGIYLPTFRGGFSSEFDLFEKYNFNIEKLENFLKDRNILLYIKLHPMNLPSESLLKQIATSENIKFYKEDDIYDSLNIFNFLITDYSSIYFDYLLLDRPIIFTPFDINEYLKEDREFYYDYEEITPGPKAKNWDEVINYIDENITNPDKFRGARERVRKIFHKYCDGKSNQRVYEEITNLIDTK